MKEIGQLTVEETHVLELVIRNFSDIFHFEYTSKTENTEIPFFK